MTRRTVITGGSGFIGTNLVGSLLGAGHEVVNIDIAAPRDRSHRPVWRSADVADRSALARIVADVRPTHVVHLAARTDLGGTTANDYAVNPVGTANLLAVLDDIAELQRVVVASSLLVCRNGYLPTSDIDYCPTTAYGRSKQHVEELVRGWPGPWVITRPTSVWGPWFGTPYRDFFDRVLAGRYVHPGRRRVDKAFGFVANTVVQIEALLDRGPSGTTHYLADRPAYRIDELADEIADAAGRRRPRRVPVAALRVAALVGDAARRMRLWSEPPLTRFRLENMLTASAYPSEQLDRLVGPLPHTMAEGVGVTLDWMREHPYRDR